MNVDYFKSALLHHSKGNWNKAKEIYEHILKSNPNKGVTSCKDCFFICPVTESIYSAPSRLFLKENPAQSLP